MILGPTGQWPVIGHPALKCQNIISKNNTMRESFYLI